MTLVNDVNFMLYTPFLPEAAAGTMEPRHVVTPLRSLLDSFYLRTGAIQAHNKDEQTVLLKNQRGEEEWLHYDRLILALGSVSRTLPVPGLEEYAIGFKSLADAMWLRNNLIEAIEEADSCADPERCRQLLTWVFVGGGYAGLEAIAELQDFAASIIGNYPHAARQGMRWILVDAAERVLPEIDERLADYAARQLKARGIEIMTGTTLREVGEDYALLSPDQLIETRNVVWTAGVEPHPSATMLDLPLTERGQISVDRNLQVVGLPGVWALGDCAAVPEPGGTFAPPAAQHAIRQARVVAGNVAASLGVGSSRPYQFKSKNAFVNLGRYKAVGKVGPLRFSGALAWWLARTYHLLQIPGPSRKVRAVLDWTIGLPFQRDLSEIGSIGHPRPLSSEQYKGGGSHRPVGR